jgi:hypothetical protein
MKPLLFLALICSATTAWGQSSSHENAQTFGERLSVLIERFVKHVQREVGGVGAFAGEDTLPKKPARKPRIEEHQKPDLTYEGNTTIEKDDRVEANVVVKGGDLTVYGTIDGDVLVVGGTLYVKEGGQITGDARVINGKIVKDEGGLIEGTEDTTSSRTASYREPRERFRSRSPRLDAPWVNELTTLDNFLFRYNRVEGIFLGLGSEKRYYWDGSRDYNAYGHFGYGFKSHKWRINLGLTRQFVVGDGQLVEVGLEGHNLTDTKDHWLIGQGENTAAAFFIHEDYRDYFERAGWGANAAYTVQTDDLTSQFNLQYLQDKYRSMNNRTEWSLFGGDKVFRLNPPIDEGTMHSVVVSLGISTRKKSMYGEHGWSAFGTAEFAEQSFGGDFGFRQYTVDVRRYQPLGRYDNLNIRVRAGTSEGMLPVQRLYEIGGLSTVQVLPFKTMSGNRMLLVNAEYILNSNVLHDVDFWPSWLTSGVNLLFIADAGWTNTVRPSASFDEGFGSLRLKQFRSNLGVGVSNRSGSFRLAYLWSTDGTNLNRIIFRFSRPF